MLGPARGGFWAGGRFRKGEFRGLMGCGRAAGRRMALAGFGLVGSGRVQKRLMFPIPGGEILSWDAARGGRRQTGLSSVGHDRDHLGVGARSTSFVQPHSFCRFRR